MFRDKEFLVQNGMYKGCREDTFYIIGSIYDEVIETGKFNIEYIEQIREYLDTHREVINNATYNISLTDSIIKRFKEAFINKIPNQVVEQPCNIILKNEYNIKELLEDNSIRRIKTEWENKKGIYGIYVNNNLVYIGSTYESFKSRFIVHKGHIKRGENDLFLYRKIREALNNGRNVEFKPIIILEDLKMEHKKTINEKEMKCMEMALIITLQPIYNISGRLKPFDFGSY